MPFSPLSSSCAAAGAAAAGAARRGGHAGDASRVAARAARACGAGAGPGPRQAAVIGAPRPRTPPRARHARPAPAWGAWGLLPAPARPACARGRAARPPATHLQQPEVTGHDDAGHGCAAEADLPRGCLLRRRCGASGCALALGKWAVCAWQRPVGGHQGARAARGAEARRREGRQWCTGPCGLAAREGGRQRTRPPAAAIGAARHAARAACTPRARQRRIVHGGGTAAVEAGRGSAALPGVRLWHPGALFGTLCMRGLTGNKQVLLQCCCSNGPRALMKRRRLAAA